jgi:hypothetical protein
MDTHLYRLLYRAVAMRGFLRSLNGWHSWSGLCLPRNRPVIPDDLQ